jgi:hypothetical protein
VSLTVDCGEGSHAVCRGAGKEHYLIPQLDDGEEFVCACRCHIVDPDPKVVEALKQVVEEDSPAREPGKAHLE